MTLPLPLWLLRKIVRRNPWLLAEGGAVNRMIRVPLLLWEVEIHGRWALTPANRERLLAEASPTTGTAGEG